MTEKLYYNDSYLSCFSAEVVDVIHKNNKIAVILNRTGFFPEGGGQLSDSGYIDIYKVSYVYEESDVIYHYIEGDESPEIGINVSCKIDWNIRFQRMQSHSGEHIFSGIAHNKFCVENVGFHMDENHIMTVDFDKPLSKEQISEIEIVSNECIYANLSVTAEIYNSLSEIPFDFRSKIDFSDSVRIVTIGDVDRCACCAPHVNNTGEIGLLKVLQSISHRGGVRITLICGKTAFDDYISKYNQTINIAAMLCSPHSETDKYVLNLIEQNKEAKYKVNEQKKRLIDYISSSVNEDDIITEFFADLSGEELRILATELIPKCKTAVFLFSGDDNQGYSFCIASETLELSNVIKEFRSSLGASGGGRGAIVQGKLSASEEQIRNFIKEKEFVNL